jgi:hypothetical protein
MNLVSQVRLDKTKFSVGSLHDDPDERAFWWSKTPHERLAAMEFLRQLNYGYDPDTARLERVFEVVECSWR